jgi:predicted lipid-binding transport protein (Tim44 family)
MMNINFDPANRKPKGPVAQILTVVVGAVMLGAALLFSFVFFAVLAVVVLIFGGYFWWKTRALRAQIRQQMQAMQEQAAAQQANPDFAAAEQSHEATGEIIEGEAVRVPEEREKLPGKSVPE